MPAPDNTQNNSSSGGYIPPLPQPSVLQDDALDDALQALVVNLTGLNTTLVRPRWQPSPPNRPGIGVDWASIGVVRKHSDTYAHVVHVDGPDGEGQDNMQRHELLMVMCTHYGPNAGAYADLVRDGLTISQNREALQLDKMDLVEVQESTHVPEQLAELWYNRVDQMIVLRRQVDRTFAVKHIKSFTGKLVTDVGLTRDVNAPPEPGV